MPTRVSDNAKEIMMTPALLCRLDTLGTVIKTVMFKIIMSSGRIIHIILCDIGRSYSGKMMSSFDVMDVLFSIMCPEKCVACIKWKT